MTDFPTHCRATHERLRDVVVKTPLVRLSWLDTPKRKVWAKLENQQVGASFKWRGAMTAGLASPHKATLVTGSAGNHGLALAMAANHLGRDCRVHVPYSAADVKVKRIQRTNVVIEPTGRDLFDCIKQARAGCGSSEVFISPFEDHHVMAGQGTITLDLHEQYPAGFDHLVLPLGGGGLFAGMSCMARDIWPDVKCHAVLPSAFQRALIPGTAPTAMAQPVFPTIADGLAVQQDQDSWLQPFVQQNAASYSYVSETEINAAVISLLNQESQLAEGAGAIGVAALLYDAGMAQLEGDVCVLISGGNISLSKLTNAITSDFAGLPKRGLLGLKDAELISEAIRKPAAPTRKTAAAEEFVPTGDKYISSWHKTCKRLDHACEEGEALLRAHVDFVRYEKLTLNKEAVSDARLSFSRARQLLKNASADTQRRSVQRKYRLATQHYAFAIRALEWCSAASDQAVETNFFDPASAQSAAVNYERYGSSVLQAAEQRVGAMLGFDLSRQALLLTSSGQAAFTLIETHLTHERVFEQHRIATVPYIYFEADEQLSNLNNTEIHTAPDWSVESLISTVETADCQTVFLDPVANKQTLDLFDIRAFAEAVRGRGWADRTIVIDGTMVSGGFNPFIYFDGPGMPRLLYYESASKYAQLGLDLQMAGVVVAPSHLASELSRLRRNSGTVMYSGQVHLLPQSDRQSFLARMQRLSQNAQHIAEAFIGLQHPLSSVHARFPSDWRERGWAHGGSVLTLEFSNAGLNNRQLLDALIDRMLEASVEAGVALTKGVSFGFSTTRVSAAAAMADQTDPFLRISAGDENPDEVRHLTDTITRATVRFLDIYYRNSRAQ